MPRINDELLDELIANQGYSSDVGDTVRPTGVLRLALDLREARKALAEANIRTWMTCEQQPCGHCCGCEAAAALYAADGEADA